MERRSVSKSLGFTGMMRLYGFTSELRQFAATDIPFNLLVPCGGVIFQKPHPESSQTSPIQFLYLMFHGLNSCHMSAPPKFCLQLFYQRFQYASMCFRQIPIGISRFHGPLHMRCRKGDNIRPDQKLAHFSTYACRGAAMLVDIIAGVREDPIERFRLWFRAARRCRTIEDATAACLSTMDPAGLPNGRMVLLKDFDARGFVFYTNLHSLKGKSLQKTPRAALTFYWAPLKKQVRIQGRTEMVSDAEADAYWATRPRLAQLGAWASKQTDILTS